MRIAASIIGFIVCFCGIWLLLRATAFKKGRTSDADVADIFLGAFAYTSGGLAGMWFAFTA